jgi:hypothetical protein
MELHEIKFTKEEFNMIIKGIEGLPHQDSTGELMGGLLESILLDKMPPEVKKKRDMDQARENAKKKLLKDNLKEDCCILQAKLIQLRRYMEANNMIIEAQEIINNTK